MAHHTFFIQVRTTYTSSCRQISLGLYLPPHKTLSRPPTSHLPPPFPQPSNGHPYLLPNHHPRPPSSPSTCLPRQSRRSSLSGTGRVTTLLQCVRIFLFPSSHQKEKPLESDLANHKHWRSVAEGQAGVWIHQVSRRHSQAPFKKVKGAVQLVLFHPSKPHFFVAVRPSDHLSSKTSS